MSRKLDLPALLLFTAILFGIVVRFYPATANGFPLNDGGMFFTMAQDLKANGYALPHFTNYNHADIPFAYPPFGFYIAALLSSLIPDSDLIIFLYLPAVINSLSILVFYLFAKEIINSRTSASLATLIYALSPRTFVWQIMGGGITRAFGMLFLLLMLWQAILLFRKPNRSHLFLTSLFGAGTVISHPQTALHAALGGFLLFLCFGLNKRGFISAFFTGLGVALLSSPWWGTVLARHGIEPFISAGQTSQRTLESYLGILKFDGLGDILFLPILFLAFIGIFLTLRQKSYFLFAWAFLALLIDPRGGEGIALLSLATLAGMGLVKFSGWISRMDSEQAEVLFTRRRVQILWMGLVMYFIMTAVIFDFQLVNTSLKAGELEMIEWVNENTTEGATFLLATGREFSMTDPLQEWFPALTEQKSTTTLQGLEWTLAENFFPWHEQLTLFQHCADIACVDEWVEENDVDYDYLIVMIPREGNQNGLADSLKRLGESAQISTSHELMYKSERALVFELKK